MNFWKYHINGNDFLILHTRKKLSKEYCQALLDRRSGIGADGIGFLYRSAKKMNFDLYNRKFEKTTFCANGIRCAGSWYMNMLKEDSCEIVMSGKTYRLKQHQNLVTVETPLPKEIGEDYYQFFGVHHIRDSYMEEEYVVQDVCQYQNYMNFQLQVYKGNRQKEYNFGNSSIVAFYHGFMQKQLHKISICQHMNSKSLLQYNQNRIFLSSKVCFIAKGSLEI